MLVEILGQHSMHLNQDLRTQVAKGCSRIKQKRSLNAISQKRLFFKKIFKERIAAEINCR